MYLTTTNGHFFNDGGNVYNVSFGAIVQISTEILLNNIINNYLIIKNFYKQIKVPIWSGIFNKITDINKNKGRTTYRP